jgi:hypothetical protein
MTKPITLDQQIEAHGPDPDAEQIAPNSLIPCRLGLEPMGAGVRITARDQDGRVLWGVVASEPMLKEGEFPVGAYDRLRELLAEYGVDVRAKPVEPKELVSTAISELDALVQTIIDLRASLEVKSPSEATARRAEVIRSAAREAALTLKQGRVR